MNGDVGMHHVKNCGNKKVQLAVLSRILVQSMKYVSPLSNIIMDTSTNMCNPSVHYNLVAHDCTSTLNY